ncbi:glutamate-rich WD repeat-containing protein 1 [Schistocerca serialis cubense]|uniref:glutamate-rich WD repeat-containing protein 1 n=1 Tax=Schistocerca serialis cubense TaxID=2023355 RepID=UPI00214E9A14|nr:glutamate-rich WD repeat-containing protein 1 [Schistocerca serialis cubense]
MENQEMDLDEQDSTITTEDGSQKKKKVYLPGKPLKDGQELVCDESAYIMLHQAQTGSPCLSFDIIKDTLGDNRENFPLTAYAVAGTQSPKVHTNSLIVMKLSNMHQIKQDEEDDESSDSDSDDDDDDNSKKPQMKWSFIHHKGCVNRVRVSTYEDLVLTAAWSELGNVSVWNITPQLREVDQPQNDSGTLPGQPLYTFTGHQSEGFGLDWSSVMPGVLASGDCKHGIHVWRPQESWTGWHVDQRPLIGHTSSVEDLQWSPNEPNVLASCSVDKSLRIWDTRSSPQEANKLTVENAHESDVNVISWNKHEPLIVSGGDDGILHIWDLRMFKEGSALATFKHHTEPVTTVEWNPVDSTVFASGGADNQIALWDLALERDDTAEEEDLKDIPPQLLFIHQGQKDIKELHWHPQLKGVILSTALSGFNIFRTISV